MKKYTVAQGSHNFKPDTLCLWWKPKGLQFKAKFDENCAYQLNTEDQQDWNKLTGITYSIDPTKNTVMIGWRYNPTKQLMELNAYYHVNGGRHFTDPLASVKLGEIFEGNIYVSKDAYTVELITKSTANNLLIARDSYEHKGTTSWISRMINPWFGGNQAAPNYMSLELDVQKR